MSSSVCLEGPMIHSAVSHQRATSKLSSAHFRITKWLGQVWLRILAFHKLFQAGLHRRLRKELAEDVDLAPQLFVGDGLDEFLRCNRRAPIKLPDLIRCRPRHPQRFALRRHLTYQPNLLQLGRIETPPGEQQIADHSIPKIALQTRNPSKTRNQSQPQF